MQNETKDGDVIEIQPKSLGTTELYPNVKLKFEFKLKFKFKLKL
jgi:hypothetical protein